jgi:hypothetical protein
MTEISSPLSALQCRALVRTSYLFEVVDRHVSRFGAPSEQKHSEESNQNAAVGASMEKLGYGRMFRPL